MRRVFKNYIFLVFIFYSSANQAQSELTYIKSEFTVADSIASQYKYSSDGVQDSILISLKEEWKGSEKTSLIYFVKSKFAASSSKYNTAISELDSALSLTKTPFFRGQYLIYKGSLSIFVNDLSTSLNSLLNAQKIAEDLEDDKLKCQVLIVRAELNRVLVKYDAALKNLEEAEMLLEQSDLEISLKIRIYDRYAAIYASKDGSVPARYYSIKALFLAEEIGDLNAQAVSHNELGFNYEHSGQIDSAIFHYNKAINIWSEIDSPVYLSNVLGNLGRLYQRNDQSDSSEYYLLWADRLIRNTTWYFTKISVYGNLSIINYHKGDSAKFYKYQSMEQRAQAALSNSSATDNVVRIEKQFEQSENLRIIEKQESEIELNKAESELEKRRANQFLIFTIISSLGLI
ncbi:MAG: tetratricopeptide repeat protein [Crocinitomicaceae bacterium]|nr:tetratricopeptide repeat protein [Crocinitomicaceae bacterium]